MKKQLLVAVLCLAYSFAQGAQIMEDGFEAAEDLAGNGWSGSWNFSGTTYGNPSNYIWSAGDKGVSAKDTGYAIQTDDYLQLVFDVRDLDPNTIPTDEQVIAKLYYHNGVSNVVLGSVGYTDADVPAGWNSAFGELAVAATTESVGKNLMVSFEFEYAGATRQRFGIDNVMLDALSGTPPTADNISTNVTEDSSVDITLSGTDPEGSNLTYNVSQPANGTVTTNGALPNVTYTPDANFAGSDSFTYTVNDGTFDSASATVSITVEPGEDDAPVADDLEVSVFKNSSVEITLSGSDPEGSNLTYNVSQPSDGTLTTNVALPNLIYTPDADFVGSDSFTYTVNDGAQDSTPGTVSIMVNGALELEDVIYNSTNNNASSYDVGGGAYYTGRGFSFITDVGNGYTLNALQFNIGAIIKGSPTPRVTIWATDGTDTPIVGSSYDDALETLTLSGTFTANSLNTFTSTGLTLEAGTTYWVVIQEGVDHVNNGFEWVGSAGAAVSDPLVGTYDESIYGKGTATPKQLGPWQFDTHGSVLGGAVIYASAAVGTIGDISIEVVSGGSEVALSWATDEGFDYGVKMCGSLTFGNWDTILTNGVPGTGGEVTITNPVSAGPEFYRAYLDH